MTDEEALDELVRDSDGETLLALTAGFRAGLAHARQWRPLTDDPASWPEVGQVVLLHTPHGGTDYDVRAWDGEWDYLLHEAQWMPGSLPPPPKGESK